MKKNIIYSPVWQGLPMVINWQMANRDVNTFKKLGLDIESTFFHQGLNYSIILNTTALIEGALDSLCRQLAFKKMKHDDVNSFQTLEKDFNKIDCATFSDYNDLIKRLDGKSLDNHFLNDELWNDIKCFFDIRNFVAHGQSISLYISSDEHTVNSPISIEFRHKFEKIQSYLQQKNLIPNSFPEDTHFIDRFLTDDVTNFFYNKAEIFLRQLGQKFNDLAFSEGELNFLFHN